MLGQLRQSVCTTPMCDAGEASVTEMDSVFQSLSPDLQSRYQSAHDGIMASFNSYWISVDRWIPFNPECCSIQQLGAQADGLTAQMQSAAGQTPVGVGPGTQAAPVPLLQGLLGTSNTTLLLAGGLIVLYFVMKK